MLARDGDIMSADHQFNTALMLARKRGARLWELRAATSLVRLSRLTGKANEARGALAMVYELFQRG